MHQHPFFNLQRHDNQELEAHLGIRLQAREVLHDWPLSSVELLHTEKQSWIYKSQYGPSVEARFYAQAQSPLLLTARPIGKHLAATETGHSQLLLPYLDAPLLRDYLQQRRNLGTVVTIGKKLCQQIANIKGQLPHYLDLSHPRHWQALMTDMLGQLAQLIHRGHYQHLKQQQLTALQALALHPRILHVFQDNIGLVHADLKAENIFVTPAGYRVIDWQRPIIGPRDLDLATLLISLGFSPTDVLDKAIVEVLKLLHIHWFVQCSLHWFPEGISHYNASVTTLVEQLLGTPHARSA